MSVFLDFMQNVIISGLVGTGAAFLILKFLGKSFVNNALQKNLNKFKAQLQEKTEILKTGLSIYAKEQEVSFQRVDAQRANAIHMVYQTICDSSILLSRIIIGPTKENDNIEFQTRWYLEKSYEIYESTTKFNTALRNNAIYFNNKTYIMLHKYFEIASTTTMELIQYLSSTDINKITINDIESRRRNMEKTINEKLAPIHQQTTDTFRYILGIEKEKQFKENNNITSHYL